MASKATGLTFGVELEFVVSYDSGEHTADTMDDFSDDSVLGSTDGMLVRKRMAQLLTEAGFRATSNRLSDYSCWWVSEDISINPWESREAEKDDQRAYASIELKSPIMNADDLGAFEEVERVITFLKSIFRIQRKNYTCGMHVHIGNSERPFQLRTLKTFSGLVTVFQHLIETIHPPSRRGGNDYCKPPSRAAQERSDIRSEFGFVREIELATTFGQLFDLMNPWWERNYAYNFQNLPLAPDDEGYKNTIEFRQHEGTMSPLRVVSWINLCLGLVQFSINVPMSKYMLLVLKYGGVPYNSENVVRLTIEDLLTLIGKECLWEYYKDRLWRPQDPKLVFNEVPQWKPKWMRTGQQPSTPAQREGPILRVVTPPILGK